MVTTYHIIIPIIGQRLIDPVDGNKQMLGVKGEGGMKLLRWEAKDK